MNERTAPVNTTDLTPFSSVAALRAAHNELLKEYRRLLEKPGTPEKPVTSEEDTVPLPPGFIARVESLIERGRATGVSIDADESRWTSQSLLDYWTTVLYRAGHQPPDATLVDFDPEQAPELSDELRPYMGLDAFQEPNGNLFFGRQRLIEGMAEKVRQHRLLPVVGPSGSGKSSVVLAGLLPLLRKGAVPGSERWHYVPSLVPGSDPLGNLALALKPEGVEATNWLREHAETFKRNPAHLRELVEAQKGAPALVVVDQFEELFTLCLDPGSRQAFVANLLSLIEAHAFRHTVIITVRSDFEPRIAQLEAFYAYFQDTRVQVLPLSATDLREAIERPAEMVGLKFETGIVDKLVKEILGEPAGLPLLQFALLTLWKQRERNRITWDVYNQVGGPREALTWSAEEFYDQLIPEDQGTAKRILLRLVHPTEGVEVLRNRVRREVLYNAGEARDRVDRVLDRLIAARLLRLVRGEKTPDDQVEVAHEALVRNWPRFVQWVEEERTVLRQRGLLTAAAIHWDTQGRAPGDLIGGSLLDAASQYLDLDALEKEFVQASRAAAEQARREEEARQQREQEQARELDLAQAKQLQDARDLAAARQSDLLKSKRIARAQKVTIGLVLVSALVLGWLAMKLNGSNIENRRQLSNNYWATGVQLRGQNESLKYLHFISKALSNSTEPEFKRYLLTDVQASLPATRLVNVLQHQGDVQGTAISPDRTRLLTWSTDSTARLWNASSGNPVGSVMKHGGKVFSAVFTADGNRVLTLTEATEDNSGVVRQWDARTGEPVGKVLPYGEASLAAVLSPTGDRVLTWREEGNSVWAQLLDPNTGNIMAQLAHKNEEAFGAIFSPDGNYVLTWSEDFEEGISRLRFWESRTGVQSKQTVQVKAVVFDATFSPDGNRFLTLEVSRNDTIVARLRDTKTKRTLGSFKLKGMRFGAVFSPDGNHILTWSDNYDGDAYAAKRAIVRVWDGKTGKPTQILMNDQGVIRGAVMSPDGNRVLAWRGDGTTLLWDVRTNRLVGTPMKHEGKVLGAAFSPDGNRIFGWCSDPKSKRGEVRLWKINPRNVVTEFEPAREANVATVYPDGKHILTLKYSYDSAKPVRSISKSEIHVWNVAAEKPVGEPIELHVKASFLEERGRRVRVSRGGSRVLTWVKDTMIGVFDVKTGNQVGILAHKEPIMEALFSPDGTRIITWSRKKNASILTGYAECMLWNVSTGRPLGELTVNSKPPGGFEFSPDGSSILAWGRDSTAILLDTQTGRLLLRLEQLHGEVQSASFNPKGQTVLIHSIESARRNGSPAPKNREGVIQQWDVKTGKIAGVSIRPEGIVWKALMSPDGTSILTLGEDGTGRLWDGQTGAPVGRPMHHEGTLNEAAFSPDGNLISTIASERTVRLWQARTGRPIGEPLGRQGVALQTVFSSDGKRVIIASRGGNVSFWDVDADLDLPPDLFELQVAALTGTTLQEDTQEVKCLPLQEWQEQRRAYEQRAREHYQQCRYPSANLWHRFYNAKSGRKAAR